MKPVVLIKAIDNKEPVYVYFNIFFGMKLFLYILSIEEYKKCILKGIICTNDDKTSRTCVEYARTILQGRFELGEEMISKNGSGSYRYTRDVLKERFILGEESIKDSYYKETYENKFNIKL